MRKKSHIALAGFIAENTPVNELQAHRKAFALGSILPDCKPSFVTTKHEFFGTFDMVQEKIRMLTEDCDLQRRNARVYWRRLGEVIHYIADYFTFPHNGTFQGSLKEHCDYEQELKLELREAIRSGQAQIHAERVLNVRSVSELIEYIRERHAEYLAKKRCVADDIAYILTVCYQVVSGMVQLLMRRESMLEAVVV